MTCPEKAYHVEVEKNGLRDPVKARTRSAKKRDRGEPLDIDSILAELKRERDKFDRAIAALEGLGSSAPRRLDRAVDLRRSANKKRSGGITPAGRRRLSEAMKRRWAERRKKGS